MEAPASRACPNCKKQVPEVNYELHSVYCARNLKICQQCKEPVAISDMETHTAQIPCGQCGEVMQACDVPSHKSDACALTQVQCAFCELMLERKLMAEHELYCGTRTEACPDCKELVMFKYQKLHLESNHGFIKLEDEPGPTPSWKMPSKKDSSKNHLPRNSQSINRVMFSDEPKPETARVPEPTTSRGAIKKRMAPQPPTKQNMENNVTANSRIPSSSARTADPLPMYEAMKREQSERRHRERENAIRRENNLPPILTTAEKVDKLRKMSKQDIDDSDMRNSKKHVAKKTVDTKNGHSSKEKKMSRHSTVAPEFFDYSPSQDRLIPANHSMLNQPRVDLASQLNEYSFKPNELPQKPNEFSDKAKEITSRPKESKKNKNTVQFLNYDHENDELDTNYGATSIDRFPGIKKNLQALRKELQNCREPLEVRAVPKKVENTEVPSVKVPRAPKVKNNPLMETDNFNLYRLTNENSRPPVAAAFLEDALIDTPNVDVYDEDSLHNVMLPCEFCDDMIQASALVAHETGCRPHLTSFPEPAAELARNITPLRSDATEKVNYFDTKAKVKNTNTAKNTNNAKKSANVNFVPIESPLGGDDDDDFEQVKIPCEFCMSLIPACRLVWHQEACLRA